MSKPSLNRLLPKFHRHTEEDTSALLSPERTGEATGQGESPNKIKRGRCSVFEHLGTKSATDVLKNLDSILGSRTIPIKFIATTHENQRQPPPPLILESWGSGTSSFKHSYIILIYWIISYWGLPCTFEDSSTAKEPSFPAAAFSAMDLIKISHASITWQRIAPKAALYGLHLPRSTNKN